jgi:hypothetical protein
MPSTEFEHSFPAIKHLQMHILDLTDIGVGFPLILKVRVSLTLEQITKVQTGSRGIALLFL